MTFSIFLTGATGFLGTQVARRLLAETDARLVAVVRAADHSTAQKRLRREWWDFPDLRERIGERIQVYAGDISTPRFGLDTQTYHRLVCDITHIIHTAADIRLFAPFPELRKTNVIGTQTVLDFSRLVHNDHGLQRLAHISTAYVAGRRSGTVAEEDLSDQHGFLSPYEQSKYEAELLVRNSAADLPISIFRPGMIVGDSSNGEIKTFNTLYLPLRLYLTGRFSISPANPAAKVNLVPVDYVAWAITRLVFEPLAAGRTFHLTPPNEQAPTQSQMAEFTRKWARAEMGVILPKAKFIPLPAVKSSAWLFEKIGGKELASFARLIPYFQNQPVFLHQNSDELLGPYPHRWQDLMPPLLSYAVRFSFWQRSSRTVHEQIMLRLQSKSRPIVFHDLVAGQDIVRSSTQLYADILALVHAFQSIGISAGDRVAIVGQNNSRYLCILVACGLSGIVAVPLYATSPPSEIACLLEDSRSKAFLVGATDVIQNLDAIHFANIVVSFCNTEPSLRPQRHILSWQDFLALGSEKTPPQLCLVELDAPAAIFYTSGTTGQPKGVIYHHSHLRWLAETLGSMYPWRERNRWGSYLSYLPMNHVVEGILATYSPYYVPAALDIYFLADFNSLPQALLSSRPTIFFSVPRFFEKVHAAFLENPIARTYFKFPAGRMRKLLSGLLRRRLLRKTGLDRCKQIIVGSAQSSPDLLDFFHDLGIEIHNAYGLTEAPLVTLNRLGHNRIDTLGQPLPETDICFEADGEIKIRGPQVTAGYLENNQIQSLEEGWLLTGDLGTLNKYGDLTIFGRKKDLIITAYGKKIFPAPIEARLRSIPGIAEALLIGDSRAYCIALIWVNDDVHAAGTFSALHTGVAGVNAHLSHAEQIKRWAILPGHLSIMDGTLTGSMKLKRDVLSQRFRPVIDALYQNEPPPEQIFFENIDRSSHITH